MKARPSAMILRKQPYGKWKDIDHLLIEAYNALQNEICPQCKMPLYICSNSDDDLRFKRGEYECEATTLLRKWEREDQDKHKDGDAPAGKYYVPHPYSESGRPLDSFRDEYWEGQRKYLTAILPES